MHLVVIFGPPAVGKMAVGRELARITGFKLFHNHMSVEPVLDIFPFGSPPFTRLVAEIRRRIIEEAAAGDLPGLVFTYVWAIDDPGDQAMVERYVDIVESRGGEVSFVELAAPQEVRLARNATPLRLDAKRSKRDVATSDGWLRDADASWCLNTDSAQALAELVRGRQHTRIDNADLPPDAAAARIAATFDLV